MEANIIIIQYHNVGGWVGVRGYLVGGWVGRLGGLVGGGVNG